MELPQTPPCGPQFGVRRINLFRVGGEEAIGPGSSRCGAERGEPPILHAWARVPCPPAASLSAPLSARPAAPAPRLGDGCSAAAVSLPGPTLEFGGPRTIRTCVGRLGGPTPQGVLRPRDVTGAPGCSFPLLIIGRESRVSSDPSLCGQSLNGCAS